jgi:2,4-dienoyl-CoA reductase-like NADH-dependent reductase (Old Yellow Enzyme family)
MTTVADCAVAPGGRTSGDRIWMRPAAVAGLQRLTEVIHAEGAVVSAQIGHPGRPLQQGPGPGAGAVFQLDQDAVRQKGHP